mmetsp:Transcript_23881/g.71074  ORF Transcript_23881/g.71074 Transcript_23881/m.71074 type:complete len:330 (+) Transcript_23881:135-1124(+)
MKKVLVDVVEDADHLSEVLLHRAAADGRRRRRRGGERAGGGEAQRAERAAERVDCGRRADGSRAAARLDVDAFLQVQHDISEALRIEEALQHAKRRVDPRVAAAHGAARARGLDRDRGQHVRHEAAPGCVRGWLIDHDVLYVVDRDGFPRLVDVAAVEAPVSLSLAPHDVDVLLGDGHPSGVGKVGSVDVGQGAGDHGAWCRGRKQHGEARRLAPLLVAEELTCEFIVEEELLEDFVARHPRAGRIDRELDSVRGGGPLRRHWRDFIHRHCVSSVAVCALNLESLASNDARWHFHLVLRAVGHDLDALAGARAHGALNLHEAHRTLGRS